MEDHTKQRQFIYPIPIYQFVQKFRQRILKPIQNPIIPNFNHSNRIKDYHNLFKSKKLLMENYQKLHNRISLLKKQQQKLKKKKTLCQKKSMYLNRFKNTFDNSHSKKQHSTEQMIKSEYKKSRNFKSQQSDWLIPDRYQISKIKARNIKKQSRSNQKLIKLQKQAQLSRKLKTAGDIKRHRLQGKQNFNKFYTKKQDKISEQIFKKMLKQENEYKKIKNEIQKLEEQQKDMYEKLQKSNPNIRLKFQKI